MFRKRATPAPGFHVPAMYNPMTGKFARLGPPKKQQLMAYGILWGGTTSPPSDGGTLHFANADSNDSNVVCSASAGTITINKAGTWLLEAVVEFQGSPTGEDYGLLNPGFEVDQDNVQLTATGALGYPSTIVISGLGYSSYGTATFRWEITTTATLTVLKIVVHLPVYGGNSTNGFASAHGNASLMVAQLPDNSDNSDD